MGNANFAKLYGALKFLGLQYLIKNNGRCAIADNGTLYVTIETQTT